MRCAHCGKRSVGRVVLAARAIGYAVTGTGVLAMPPLGAALAGHTFVTGLLTGLALLLVFLLYQLVRDWYEHQCAKALSRGDVR